MRRFPNLEGVGLGLGPGLSWARAPRPCPRLAGVGFVHLADCARGAWVAGPRPVPAPCAPPPHLSLGPRVLLAGPRLRAPVTAVLACPPGGSVGSRLPRPSRRALAPLWGRLGPVARVSSAGPFRAWAAGLRALSGSARPSRAVLGRGARRRGFGLRPRLWAWGFPLALCAGLAVGSSPPPPSAPLAARPRLCWPGAGVLALPRRPPSVGWLRSSAPPQHCNQGGPLNFWPIAPRWPWRH